MIALILLATMFIAYHIYKRHCYALAKKSALKLLATCEQQYEKNGNVPLTSAHISELLRRVALVYYPREQVASLHGDTWLQFLNQTGKGINFNEVREMLLDAPFKTNDKTNLGPLFNHAKRWINQRGMPCSN